MAYLDTGFYKASAGLGRNATRQIFSYTTTDAIATVKVSDYFNGAGHKLEEDDLIYVVASDDRELLYVSGLNPDTVVDLVSASSGTIPDGSVTEAKLDAAVIAKLLGTNNVGATHLEAAGVETAALKDLNVTEGKLAAAVAAKLLGTNNIVPGNMAALSVETAAIANANVTDEKLESNFMKIVAQHSAAATATTSQAFTISGVDATDKAFATMIAGFTQPITGCVCTSNTVTLTYAAAASPTADVVEILVWRTTS